MDNTTIKGHPLKTIYMPEQAWRKWDAALRSGDYAQGRGTLCRKYLCTDGTIDRYCCLGVLEKVVSGEVENSSMPSIGWLFDKGIAFVNPSIATAGWVRDPYLPSLDKTASIANDGKTDAGMTLTPMTPFIEIADAIKQCVFFTDSDATPFDEEIKP